VKTVERIEEIPEIEYQDRFVEVPIIHEIVRRIPRIEVIEIPIERVIQVPKKIIQEIEQPVYRAVPHLVRQPVDRVTPVPRTTVQQYEVVNQFSEGARSVPTGYEAGGFAGGSYAVQNSSADEAALKAAFEAGAAAERRQMLSSSQQVAMPATAQSVTMATPPQTMPLQYIQSLPPQSMTPPIPMSVASPPQTTRGISIPNQYVAASPPQTTQSVRLSPPTTMASLPRPVASPPQSTRSIQMQPAAALPPQTTQSVRFADQIQSVAYSMPGASFYSGASSGAMPVVPTSGVATPPMMGSSNPFSSQYAMMSQQFSVPPSTCGSALSPFQSAVITGPPTPPMPPPRSSASQQMGPAASSGGILDVFTNSSRGMVAAAA
jgi:hypothetical protein